MEPVWIGRGQDANGAKVTTFLDHKNILGYPDDYVQSTVKHAMDFVADHLKSRGWDKGCIGVEMDGYYYTAAANESPRPEPQGSPLPEAGANGAPSRSSNRKRGPQAQQPIVSAWKRRVAGSWNSAEQAAHNANPANVVEPRQKGSWVAIE